MAVSDVLDVRQEEGGGRAQVDRDLGEDVLTLARPLLGRERRELVEPLGEAEPGGAAVREQEARAVRELEVGSRGGTRVLGADRQAGRAAGRAA